MSLWLMNVNTPGHVFLHPESRKNKGIRMTIKQT